MDKNTTEITRVYIKETLNRIYDDGCYHGYKYGYKTGFKNGVLSAIGGYLGYRVVKAVCKVYRNDEVIDKPESEEE